jgi:hypothetical protein
VEYCIPTVMADGVGGTESKESGMVGALAKKPLLLPLGN